MKKMMFMLMIVPMILFGNDFDPDQYRYFVTSNEEEYPIIQLSDDSRWCLSNEWIDKDLSIPFGHGTEVFLMPSLAEGYDDAIYMYDGEMIISCHMLAESKKLLPTIIGTSKVCIEQPGWFTYGKYKEIISLSDGSQWELTQEFGTLRDGHHVLVVLRNEGDYEEFRLIDMDKRFRWNRPEDMITNENWAKPFIFIQDFTIAIPALEANEI